MFHYLKNIRLDHGLTKNLNEIVVGAGCFWGVEKKFWDLEGVFLTSVRSEERRVGKECER